jgi:SH3-like domain-containing protein
VKHRRRNTFVSTTPLILLALALLISAGCGRAGKLAREYVYVSSPQVTLRDRLSAVYTKVGMVKNGERVQVLEKSKRFYRVRTDGGAEGWIEIRYVIAQDIYDGFEKLRKDNADAPSQAHGVTRADLNTHLTPSRDGEHLYQLKEGEKVEILKRAIAEKQGAMPVRPLLHGRQKLKTTATTTTVAMKPEAAAPDIPKLYEDWSLVRDSQKRVGWLLARMVDIDVPMDIAQYAEGQRIVASFVLNTVTDSNSDTGQTKSVPQYLVLTTEPRDGQPFDFNHIRVFSWNLKRHRYETAYREHDLYGMFPVSVGHEVFDKEGDLPMFTLHVKDENGNTIEKKYKMNGPMVKRVMSPAEEQADKQARAQRLAEKKAARAAVRTAKPKRRR